MKQEIHGVRATREAHYRAVQLIEFPDHIHVTCSATTLEITSEEARYLARQLNRLARRIELGEARDS
jgi:hypothetical protein